MQTQHKRWHQGGYYFIGSAKPGRERKGKWNRERENMEGLVVRREGRRGPEEVLNLPAGFRFYPTDEELVVHYLCKKAAAQPFAVPIIAEVDLYKFDPWDLPEKALFGEKEWYFFSPRDRKYPNGSRPNRAAGAGYWKATGTDKPITCSSRKVGIKKALVFYKGKPPKGSKTNWIMHEYRLAEPSGKSMNALKCGGTKKASLRMDDWVLCRIYFKKIVGATQKDSAEISAIRNIDSANDDCVDINTEEEQHNRCVSDANNNNNNNMLNSPPSPKFYANNNASSTSLEECSRDDDSTIDELEQECERHLSMDRNVEEEHHLEFPPNSDSSQNDSLYNTFNVSQEDASMRVLDDTNSCQQLYSNSTLDRLESLLSLIDKGLFGNIGGGLLNRPL